MSSNAYANGSNQNCGNVITDRATTRVLAPPGGGSTFSLAWDSGPDQGRKENRGNRAGTSSSDYGSGKLHGAYQQQPYQQQQQQQQQQPPPQAYQPRPSYNPYAQQQAASAQPNATTRNRSNQSTLSFGEYPQEQHPQQQQQRLVTARRGSQEVGGRGGGVPPGSAAFQAPESLAAYQARQQDLRSQPPFQCTSGGYGQQQPAYHHQQQQQQQQQQRQQQQQQQQPAYQQPPPQQYGGGGQAAFGAKPFGMTQGSNSYANGAHQNCGNVITDRATTRVLAPPGGRSTFQLG